MTIQMTGLTGFDWRALVDQLMQVESYPLQNIQKRVDSQEAKKEAWSKLDSLLKDLRTASQKLLDRSAFSKTNATVGTTSSGNSPFKATVTGNAATGFHQIEIVSLAEAEVMASHGFASSTSALNVSGSFMINGKTIMIDANDSLATIRDVINAAGAGVSASVVETVPGSEYKLVIKSDTQGEAGIDYIDAFGTGASLGLSVVVDGADAVLVVDGLEVRRTANTVTDVIEGVTLELYRTSGGEKVSLALSPDRDAIAEVVDAWVKAYNETKRFINDQRTAPQEGAKAPPLFSDSGLRQAERSLQSALGFDLSILGITRTKEGLIEFDKHTFLTQLEADPESLKALFQATSTSTDPELAAFYIPNHATPGTYEIEITSLATRATLSGAGFGGTFIATGGGDRTLSIQDANSGKVLNFVLTDGEAVSDIVARLNQAFEEEGIAIMASVNPDETNLTLTHERYGSAHGFTLSYTDPDLDQLGLAQGSVLGSDVQGKINGQMATGSGQDLVSEDGIRFQYTGATTGLIGRVDVAIGAAARMESTVYRLMLGDDSIVQVSKSGIDNIIHRLQGQKTRIEDRLAQRRAMLEKQFLRMEQVMSMLQSQNAYLMASLGGLMMG